jgi:2-amino-4-hydroxy-6-hydroxymethyldihydropteridine diphosphokinase
MIVPVGIALGSNLGDRDAELDEAIVFLHMLSEDNMLWESPRFETPPVDCPPGSPPFLNSVVEIEVDTVCLPPLHLLACLQEFEQERGRSPVHDVNAARQIDMDIIYYGVEQINDLGLIIPHPRATTRRFVLEPLAHLRPELILPGQKKSVQELLDELLNEGVSSGSEKP